MARYRSYFRCFSGCPGEHDLTEPLYLCPACGGLLMVEHDTKALHDRDPSEWKRLFEERFRSTTAPFASGVWGKREWVAPGVDDAHVVSTGEGGTPLFHAERLGREVGVPELWVKQCGQAHTGSFKDLGMTVLVSVVAKAIAERAAPKAGASASRTFPRVLACASTGDTSASLAAYGAVAGLPVAVLLPRGRVSLAQLVQPLAHGAKVFALDADFDGCMRVVEELARRGIIYLANSMNPLRIEGQKTVAIEMAQQMGWRVPDWVFLPSGNLGNAAALHAGFRMMKDLGLTDRIPRLCIAQAERANPMYRAFMDGKSTVDPIVARTTVASAIQIGNPVSAPRAMAALSAMNGVVEDATEDEIGDACARADRTGLYTCPHTGVALAALFKLRSRGVVTADQSAVVVSTASGLKFTEFKLGYHDGKLAGITSRLANHPVEIAADADEVAKALA
jgi:threonine synthase